MFIDTAANLRLELRRSEMFPAMSKSHQQHFRSSGAGRILRSMRSINIMSLRDCRVSLRVQ